MALTPGTRLGVYEVIAQIGEGGMGQVYRATDTTLGRQVAIKILPDAFAVDPDRLARFEREAKTLASLNHPNIAAIYGFEQSAGRHALVMELVEGEDLSQRIARGAIPIEEALPIAKQIAEALEAAHEQGIMHRDLKPANIKIRSDGTVKVLDFGLAKAVEPTGAMAASASMAPTITTPALMTGAGMILGTAAYMSPEQARGKTVDKRADIWAFGAVVFEMLTGMRAFPGEDLTDTLAAVVKLDPKWDAVHADVPARVRQVLRVCLQKDPRQRAQAIGDVRLALEGAFDLPSAPQDAQLEADRTQPARRAERLAWGAVVAVLAVAAVWLVGMAFPPAQPAAELRLDIATGPTTRPSEFAISPDGQRIVYSADGPRLWLRSLNSTVAMPLKGTEGGTRPFWSSDSRSIGFFVNNELRRIAADGGAAQTVTPTGGGVARGGGWNRDDVIVFAPSPGSPILKVPAAGGQATAVTQLDPPRQTGHFHPQFLPDGRHFLYYAIGSPEAQGVYVGDLMTSESRRLFASTSAAVYASSALFFIRDGTLLAQRFDLTRLELLGDPAPIAEQVLGEGDNPALSAAPMGPIVFRAGSQPSSVRQLAWFDRSGRELGPVGGPDTVFGNNPALSPDGRLVALLRVVVSGNADVWLLDVARGLLSRFTFDPNNDVDPIWSPDGRRVVFSSDRDGTGDRDLYVKSITGPAGSEEFLLDGGQRESASDWSSDGRWLLYRSEDSRALSDIWALPLAGEKKPVPVAQTDFDERDGRFSPDGQWIAYESNKSGRPEIFLQPFPGPGADVQVSTTGGTNARWRRDGKELFYIAPDGQLMAVPIALAADGKSPEPRAPVPLFVSSSRAYMVAPDGQRFLFYTTTEEPTTAPLTVLLNWAPTP